MKIERAPSLEGNLLFFKVSYKIYLRKNILKSFKIFYKMKNFLF